MRLWVAQVWYSGGPKELMNLLFQRLHSTQHDLFTNFQMWKSPKCLWNCWQKLLWGRWKIPPTCDHAMPTSLQLISPRNAWKSFSGMMGLLAQSAVLTLPLLEKSCGEGGVLLKMHILDSHLLHFNVYTLKLQHNCFRLKDYTVWNDFL